MGNMRRVERDRSAEFNRIRAEVRTELPDLLAQAGDVAQ
jgi:hypothetical protein